MSKKLMMAGATILLGLLVFGFVLIFGSDDNPVTETEASAAVIELYGGEVERTERAKDGYTIIFNRDNGKYSAQVDRSTGRIESLALLEKAADANPVITESEASELALKEVDGEIMQSSFSKTQNQYEVVVKNKQEKAIILVDAIGGTVIDIQKEPIQQNEAEPANRVITEAEAIAIAKKTLDGEVQELEFTETEDGGFYLIEIENDRTDQEATIRVHAVRGETLTVEWED
ncbi:PepSY domain-containing protein [Planococcus sp. 107-1]|uniref:PepSY domain-containing protein n=1 Tax=Planococcus sp. 107-1 TaxID=2908840 RepID=UPI001F254678|nr:PepSY domain-containing protein [Planococcus sp. 107-1]UJF25917.1 PepSY domain-containing protein [Planococcus sp. 107-1]